LAPETRYARSSGLHIAYQVVGDGPRDVVLIDQWFSNVDAQWRLPPLARFLGRLASFSRLILFDKRGTGLSDPVPLGGLPTLEHWMDDLRAVLDAVGSERTALVSGVGGSYMTILFAASHPDRTSALVLVDGYARLRQADDYLDVAIRDFGAADAEQLRAGWGRGVLLPVMAPDAASDRALQHAYAEYERASASPGTAAAMIGMLYDSDVRSVLPAVRVPTLVLAHAASARVPADHSRYLASHIDGARYVELPGNENLIWAGDQDAVLAETEEFLTGMRPVAEPDRVLATILFTDLVDSTRRAAELGDEGWRQLLEAHHRVVREELARARGRAVKTTGDGVLAVFDGPARGVRCALAIVGALHELGLEVRCGLHTGEIELMEGDVGGIAVHIAARIAAAAGPGEVLVSRTVRDLVVGSALQFASLGMHELRGVPDSWELLAVRG
jgi:class 3 adenylate cyclase